MPLFEYAGPGPRVYPETRDAAGANLGEVRTGDRREFNAAPDQWWVPAGDAGQDEDDPGDGSEDTGTDPEGDAPDPAGQLVPPAVIPQ